jgi:hypothetical protein
MTSIRPPIAISTLVLELVWLIIVIAAYQAEAGDHVNSLAVTVAVIGFIWAAPAIALCAVAWLFEQLLRGQAPAPMQPMAAPQPPPPPFPPAEG